MLAHAIHAADQVFVSAGYPYDLSFYARLNKPLVVLSNPRPASQNQGDGWQRELFEGAAFDAQSAQVLQST